MPTIKNAPADAGTIGHGEKRGRGRPRKPVSVELIPQTPQPDKPRAPGRLLTGTDAADYVGLSRRKFLLLKAAGKGPKSVNIDGSERYRIYDLDSWVDQLPLATA